MKRPGVMQITDSLTAGGKERMAVNLANILCRKGYRSYLCTTREEGSLTHQVVKDVERLKLARTHRFDVSAVRRFVAFIRENQIKILHAHGPSLFIAGVASLFPPYPIVVWHDNDGNHGQRERPKWIYRLGAARASGVITASEPLAEWSRNILRVPRKRVWFLPNFVMVPEHVEESTTLPGVKATRIVCLAGLRRQKDHLTLLRAMALVVKKISEAHLLIVGGSKDLEYLQQIKGEIKKQRLGQHVSLLGERQDIHEILQACRIGVLSSASEAFPLALLEYGTMGLPAVATRVGQCAEILGEGQAGKLIPPRSPDRLAKALIEFLGSPEQCFSFGKKLNHLVQERYGPDRILERVSGIYETVLGSPRMNIEQSR